MPLSSELLASLPPSHLNALRWFEQNAGRDVPWPAPLSDGTFLVNKAKGIHKPAGWIHALSIRQSLRGPYHDKDPEVRPDGSWTYEYIQESANLVQRDSQFTNQALLACLKDGVPVGVVRQIRPKPSPRYRILGLALVTDWRGGNFILEGGRQLLSDGTSVGPGDEPTDFNPTDVEDARRWVTASIVRRQGQGAFREAVLSAYANRCAVTGCDAVQAIEAAHIFPYLGKDTNIPTNGVALRSDVHTLFDLGLLAIHPATLRVELSPALRNTAYEMYQGTAVRPPFSAADAPSRAALDAHYRWAIAKWQ